MNFDISYALDETGAQERPLEDKLGESHVSILDFREPEATTDSAAFVAALTTGKPVFLPAGRGLGDDGVYLIDTPQDAGKAGYLVGGSVVFGEGMGRTVIRPADPDQDVFRQLSSDDSETQDDIVLRDLTLYGWVETEHFSEQTHLAQFNGSRNLLIERVEFRGFRGDGLYIGSGEGGEDERHNYAFTVRDCDFDGINRENRNGISIIDGDGGLIQNCRFRNTTSSSMPGAIDMEPNAGVPSVIRNITIASCSFDTIGGNIGAIAIIIPSTADVAQNIQILGNDFRNAVGTGADITVNMFRTVTATSPDSAILIDGNYGIGDVEETDGRPIALAGVRGVTITETNAWSTYPQPLLLGFNGATDLIRDVTCSARLTLVGTASGQPGLLVGKADGVRLEGMRFDRCGDASSSGCAILFLTGVTSDHVRIEGIGVVPGASQTKAIINHQNTHTFTPANNRAINNDLGGLISEFSATGPGQLLSGSATWNPGSLADGAGETSSAITVTGAAFGDAVDVAAPYDLQGVTCSGYVSASNSVKVRLQNETGGTIDLASGTWKAVVRKALG